MIDRPGTTLPRAWARFTWSPGTGVSEASGECERLLGTGARVLVESPDPLRLLPPQISAALSPGVPEAPVLVRTEVSTGIVSPQAGSALVTLFETAEAESDGSTLPDELGSGLVGVDPTGIVRIWNKAMGEIFPIPAESALGRSIDSVLPPPVLFTWPGILGVAAEGRPIRIEMRPGSSRRVEAVFTRGGPGAVGVFMDTSDSFEAERRLRSARRMNQTYFQNISTGLVMLGPDFRVLVSNRAFGRLFGVREGLVGNPVYEILPPECFAELEQASRILSEGEAEIEPKTISFTLPDGSRRVVRQSFRPVRSEEDESSHLVGIFEDLTTETLLVEKLDQCSRQTSRISSLVGRISSSRLPQDAGTLAAALGESLFSSGSALYFQDEMGTVRLAAVEGDWTAALPEDLAELRLPRAAWNTYPGTTLVPGQNGLQGFPDVLDIVPVGTGRFNRGFIILRFEDADLAGSVLEDAGIVATVLRTAIESSYQYSQIEKLIYLFEKEKRFSGALVSDIGIPVAVFGEDWRPLVWNSEMELLLGIDADTARKRPGVVIDALFGPVGGLVEARRLSRYAVATPVVWAVRKPDGSERAFSWKLSRAESAEGESVETVTVLSGVPVQIETGAAKVRTRPSEQSSQFASALAKLLQAVNLKQIASALAEICVSCAGLQGARVTLGEGPGAVSSRFGDDPGGAPSSTIPVSDPETRSTLGIIETSGFAPAPLMEILASVVSDSVGLLGRRAAGRALSEAAGRGEGRTVVLTDEQGMLLSPALAGGAWFDTGTDVSVLVPDPAEDIASVMRRAFSIGGGGTPFDGGRRFAVCRSLLAGTGRRRLAVWVIGGDPDEGRAASPSWFRMTSSIAGWIPGMAGSIGRSIRTLSRILARDDPVRPILSSISLELSALSRVSRCLDLVSRALESGPATASTLEVLNSMVRDAVAEGRRPPDLGVSGDLPLLRIDPALLSDILSALVSAVGGEAPDMGIRLLGPRDTIPEGWTDPGERCAGLTLRWSRSPAPRVGLEKALDLLSKGVVSAEVEMEMLATALELSGCIFRIDGDAVTVFIKASPPREE